MFLNYNIQISRTSSRSDTKKAQGAVPSKIIPNPEKKRVTA
jgi:hypothetical protein